MAPERVAQKGRTAAFALTSSTMPAKMVQAVASSTAADVIATVPTGVLTVPLSVRILASTGKTVILIATPMKRAK